MSKIYDALERARKMAAPGDLLPVEPTAVGNEAASAFAHDWPAEQPLKRQPQLQPRSQESSSQPRHADAAVPHTTWNFGGKFVEKIVLGQNIDPAATEQYRRLAAVLHLAQQERGADGTKILMVSSSVAGEGKTLTSVNLALILSESYQRNVLLVDGDLRRPALHEIFQVPNVGGLNDAFVTLGAKIPILRLSKNLSVLTAGRPAMDPLKVLSSERMDRFLDQVRDRFDWVLVDTPPVTLLTDAKLLASKADLIVLVVQAQKTQYAMVQRTVEAVGRERIIGVVLNRVNKAPHTDYTPPGYSAAHAAHTASK
jgi:protein-tyrosine kinase